VVEGPKVTALAALTSLLAYFDENEDPNEWPVADVIRHGINGIDLLGCLEGLGHRAAADAVRDAFEYMELNTPVRLFVIDYPEGHKP
jgi:hypothetical protein